MCENSKIVVNTVGIGNGIDEHMLQMAASKGKGSCSLIRDDEDAGILNGKIISALGNSCEPTLENCTITWEAGGKVIAQENMNVVCRNELVIRNKIITEQ